MEKVLEILKKPHHKSKFNNVTKVVYKEEQIKEVIAEIEEAMKPKTCATCINRYFERDGLLLIDHYCHLNEFPISEFFGCIRYEPKDNA